MEDFLRLILGFPVVPMTVGLGIVLLYWAFVIVGVFGIDTLDGGAEGVVGGSKAAGDAVAGAVKGAGDAVAGALKGAGAAMEGAGDAAVDGLDGGLDGADDAGVAKSAGVMSLLGLAGIPVTITGSSLVFFSWLYTVLGARFLGNGALVGSAVLAGALVAGLLTTSLALRPLRGVFNRPQGVRSRELRGSLCTITSGTVTGTFGSASVDDGGAGLIINVVCGKANELKKGERALIVDYDAARDVFDVEPVDWLSAGELEALKDPDQAPRVLSTRVRSR